MSTWFFWLRNPRSLLADRKMIFQEIFLTVCYIDKSWRILLVLWFKLKWTTGIHESGLQLEETLTHTKHMVAMQKWLFTVCPKVVLESRLAHRILHTTLLFISFFPKFQAFFFYRNHDTRMFDCEELNFNVKIALFCLTDPVLVNLKYFLFLKDQWINAIPVAVLVKK